MKHRHPSKDGEGSGGFNPDANIDPRTGEQLASGGSQVYRGVPFWERNKNPKIAQGYKEGYKYRHRKQKPLTAAELKKIEEKRNREQQKLDRKQGKEKPEDTSAEETPAEETKSEERPNGDPETDAVQANGDPVSEPTGETKAEKRQRRRESRKKKKEQPPDSENQPAEEATPKPQPPPKPAEDEKKDGF